MFDFEIAFFFYKMAKIHSVFLNSKYKAKAFHAAAMALDAYDNYVTKMYESQKLRDIPFVGEKIEQRITEIIQTGDLQELKEYEQRFGIKDYTLLLSTGLSDVLIKKLWGMNVRSAEDIMSFLKSRRCHNEITKGEKLKIEHFEQEYIRLKGKFLQAYGECLGSEIIEFMNNIHGMQAVEFCKEIHSSEKISSIKIVFNYIGNWDYLVKELCKFKRLTDISEKRESEISGKTRFGLPFTLICNKDLTANTISDFDGIDDIFLGMGDIQGDLHMHTNWTDGLHSIEQMCEEAITRGYEYISITDHSVSMRVAHGLSDNQALSQIQEIRKLQKQLNMKIFAGIEVDILKDGSLDYDDEILSQFDVVVAAIHSHMDQSAYEMEERLNKALSNPYVNILAHPTGRLLGRPGVFFSERKSYSLDVTRIIELCKTYNVALEVNCFPERLDLDAEKALLATQHGIKISLGTDAHSLAHLRNIEYGVAMLQSVGIRKDMVLNTYSFERLLQYFKSQKKGVVISEKKREESQIVLGKKDFKYYFGDNDAIMRGQKSIIGIDLTGSEQKESGWAYMRGTKTFCQRIGTDKELIHSIQEFKPTIVSIDSPLAYPKGRCCAKKDCECSKYGIMRESERLLRHFGITVYPCLIDSMVKLTTRGMKLAKTLREMGYTVIESYPGVAQDVLHIPRKGKTNEQFVHLKQGLASFGICGDLIDNPNISHDEVDAITSALVGYFYLNNQYIGLGNNEEDYLIVPRIQEELLKKRVIIGLCGETSAGKTTVAEYLRFKYGLKYFRYSQVIEEKYNVYTKQELQSIGAKISQNEQTQQELTRYMIDKMDATSSYVIDGLRHMIDWNELKNSFHDDFIFIYIDCRYRTRCLRYKKINNDVITDEVFRQINDHKSEQEIAFMQMRADYCVDNNSGYKNLWEQIDQIVKNESGGNL